MIKSILIASALAVTAISLPTYAEVKFEPVSCVGTLTPISGLASAFSAPKAVLCSINNKPSSFYAAEMSITGPQSNQLTGTLDPSKPALNVVNGAGSESSQFTNPVTHAVSAITVKANFHHTGNSTMTMTEVPYANNPKYKFSMTAIYKEEK